MDVQSYKALIEKHRVRKTNEKQSVRRHSMPRREKSTGSELESRHRGPRLEGLKGEEIMSRECGRTLTYPSLTPVHLVESSACHGLSPKGPRGDVFNMFGKLVKFLICNPALLQHLHLGPSPTHLHERMRRKQRHLPTEEEIGVGGPRRTEQTVVMSLKGLIDLQGHWHGSRQRGDW